jgi:hypothetical protein
MYQILQRVAGRDDPEDVAAAQAQITRGRRIRDRSFIAAAILRNRFAPRFRSSKAIARNIAARVSAKTKGRPKRRPRLKNI